MAYDPNDPRSQLATAHPTTTVATAIRRAGPGDAAAPPEYVEFTGDPDEVGALGSRSWIVRSQTACVVYTHAAVGDRLTRTAQPDEYVLLLLSTPERPAAKVVVASGAEHANVDEDAVVVVPPGHSELVVTAAGVVVRVFSAEATDLTARARNVAAHADAHPHTAPFAPWPAAPDGDHLRVYRLADAPVDPARFGTIYRCRTVMVNVLPPDAGPRDPSKLSPHHHDDFEQLSLQLDSDYVHHIRTPWTTNLATWRDDEHRVVSGPAVTIIPPPTVHTSQGVGEHRHQLVDLFCPPRLDFSRRPGWVLNADDYPLLPDDG